MQHISTPTEEWRPIPEWTSYEVSNRGRVKSLAREIQMPHGQTRMVQTRILKPVLLKSGYFKVTLGRGGGKRAQKYVHRLVLEAFVGPCPPGMEACHNNGNPADNRVENLRWDNRSANALDRNSHGTMYQRNRTHCPRGHALKGANIIPSEAWHGHRSCLACNRAKSYITYHSELELDFAEIADQYYSRIIRAIKRPGKAECIRGHKLEGENLVKASWEKRGERQCRSCGAARSQIRRYPGRKADFPQIADSYYRRYSDT